MTLLCWKHHHCHYHHHYHYQHNLRCLKQHRLELSTNIQFLRILRSNLLIEYILLENGLIQPKPWYWSNVLKVIFWLRLLHGLFENSIFICGMISLKILNCYKFFVYTFVTDVIFCRCASSAVSNRWIKRIRS